jgi:hypothetical protein
MSASVRSKVRQAADAEATHPNRLGAPAINLPISRQPTAGVVGRVRVLHERAVRGHRSDVDQDAGAPRAQDAQPVPITDSVALDRGRTASADRRFRVRHPPARRVFCATSDERSGASRSGRGCESDIVTARDPSTDSRDGFTAVFRLPHARTSPAPPVPRTTGHRCATSSPRRATRDRPGPDHRRLPQRMLGLVVLGLRMGPQLPERHHDGVGDGRRDPPAGPPAHWTSPENEPYVLAGVGATTTVSGRSPGLPVLPGAVSRPAS